MPITHVHKVFAVEDCKIAPITLDTSGSATTYGALIDVPGIKSVEIEGEIESKTLRGDNVLLDADAVLTEINVTVNYAKMSLDVFAAFFNSLTVVDAGTGSTETATVSLTPATSRLRPFKMEAKSPTGGVDVNTGDVHILLSKLVLTGFPPLGFEEEDYKTGSFEAMAMPTLGTGTKWLDIVVNETATAIV
jgi:hypothetical protein